MAFSTRNSRLASVGLASIIAVGIVGFGSVAFADERAGGESAAQAGERKARPIGFGVKHLLEDSGASREEVKEGAGAGLTLGEVIDQYGDILAEEAKANALADLAARLDEAVAGGTTTQERANAIEARAPALLDKILGTVPGEHRGDRPHRTGLNIAKHALRTTADVLGLDVAALHEQLASGETIAAIAGDQAQSVIDALVTDANAAIDQAVVDGRIPAEAAADAREQAAAAVERFVNEGRPRKHVA